MAAYENFWPIGGGSAYGRLWPPMGFLGIQVRVPPMAASVCLLSPGEMAVCLALALYCFMQPVSSLDDDRARTLAQWVQWATAEGFVDIVLHGVVAQLQRKCLLFCRQEGVGQKGYTYSPPMAAYGRL